MKNLITKIIVVIIVIFTISTGINTIKSGMKNIQKSQITKIAAMRG